MSLFEKMIHTRFGRLVCSIFIYGIIFLTVYITMSMPNVDYGIFESPISYFVLFGLGAFLLIQIIFDLLGFLDYDSIIDGIFEIIRGILFLAGGLAIIIFIFIIGGVLFNGYGRDYLLSNENTLGFAFYSAVPMAVALYFLLSSFFIENHEYIIPLMGIGTYVLGIIIGTIFAIIGISCSSIFLTFWLPFILSCIMFVVGVVIVCVRGFPETNSEGIDIEDFMLIIATPFIWLFKGIWFLIKYIGIFFVWLYEKIFNLIKYRERKHRPHKIKRRKTKKEKQIEPDRPKKKEKKEDVEETEEPDFDLSKYATRLSGRLGFFIRNCFGWHFYSGEAETVVSQRNVFTDVKNIFIKTFYFRRIKYYDKNIIFNITEKISYLLDYVRLFIESFWELVLVAVVICMSCNFYFVPIVILSIYALIVIVGLLGRLERKIFKINDLMQSENDILSGGNGNVEFNIKYTFKGIFGLFAKVFYLCFGYIANYKYELDAITYGSNADEMRKKLREEMSEEESLKYDYERDISDIADNNRRDYEAKKSFYDDQFKNEFLSYEEYKSKMYSLKLDTKHNFTSAINERKSKFDEDMSKIGFKNGGRIYKNGSKTVSKITQLVRPKYYTTNIGFIIIEKIASLIFPFILPILILAITFIFMEKSYEYTVLFGILLGIVIICCVSCVILRKSFKIDSAAWSLKTKKDIEENELKHKEKLELRNKIAAIDVILVCIPFVNFIYIFVISILTILRILPYRKFFKMQLIGYIPFVITGIIIIYFLYYFGIMY